MKIELISIIVIVFLVASFFLLNNIILAKKLNQENTKNIIIKNNTIDFDSLTLNQKIAQMLIVRGDNEDLRFNNLNIGGFFLDKQNSELEYKEKISKYQNNSKIKLLISTDLEGAWNPFTKNMTEDYDFPKFSEIQTKEKAYAIGLEHGKLLKKSGFNINFAPVAEYEDCCYGGRVFEGNKTEIKEKLEQYIKGLQKNVMATCKHYPGKGMIKNTHLRKDEQTITKEDLELFEICFKNNVSAIMMGHQAVKGEIDSKAKPSSVSKEVISNLDNFKGLIISDEVNMVGLRSTYLRKNKMYGDLINSGEDIILDFKLKPLSTYKLILNIEEQVDKGIISKEKIDESVKKILLSKGYKIK